jgi:hypothetical protein
MKLSYYSAAAKTRLSLRPIPGRGTYPAALCSESRLPSAGVGRDRNVRDLLHAQHRAMGVEHDRELVLLDQPQPQRLRERGRERALDYSAGTPAKLAGALRCSRLSVLTTTVRAARLASVTKPTAQKQLSAWPVSSSK